MPTNLALLVLMDRNPLAQFAERFDHLLLIAVLLKAIIRGVKAVQEIIRSHGSSEEVQRGHMSPSKEFPCARTSCLTTTRAATYRFALWGSGGLELVSVDLRLGRSEMTDPNPLSASRV